MEVNIEESTKALCNGRNGQLITWHGFDKSINRWYDFNTKSCWPSSKTTTGFLKQRAITNTIDISWKRGQIELISDKSEFSLINQFLMLIILFEQLFIWDPKVFRRFGYIHIYRCAILPGSSLGWIGIFVLLCFIHNSHSIQKQCLDCHNNPYSISYSGDLCHALPHFRELWSLLHTVKPGYNDHLMVYFTAFWSSSRWPRATLMSSRKQKLLTRVNWYIQTSLKHITE